MSVIRFEQVTKLYLGEPILRDLNLEVNAGETKVVLGGSGSGKSTILKMVLGLIRPDSGKIFVHDRDITVLDEDELNPIRKKMGMVFQEGALFDSLTVGENVAFRLREDRRYSEAEIEEEVTRVLGFVGLEDTINRMPSELSGGMRRRVAIARAVVAKPEILLYDEPTAGLDPITSRTICELVIKLRDLEQVASIFVTHDLHTAITMASEFAVLQPDGSVIIEGENERLCLINTRFVMLERGKIIFEGSDEELRQTEDEYIREFLS